ncbi:alpha/beta hydrolase [Halobacillus naozhouensis]|uniref:Alpha/beta hydrolase n=1 Tax=Halobacillus naozhouensis TaxID=554880 RepID=A0ABY8IWM3_9BACI|nr:alpha/beta hydrolase [Halobacillus naozhouensis]WFT74623.1 alpha/beta hydrolase [Halobacillus naozhouensis]
MGKVTFSNSRRLALVGDLYRNEGNRIVIMCHGFLSNRSSRGRFDLFTSAFYRLGYSVLRFDFGGCGESDDTPLTLSNEVDDLTSAMNYARGAGFTEMVLYGHSLGARVCLEAYDPQYVKTMILTGAGTGPVHYHWPDHFSQEELVTLQSNGHFSVKVSDPHRDEMVITKEMLLDFERCDQKHMLSRIICPILLIHGNKGEEKLLMSITKQGMKWLHHHSKLVVVIDGAAHHFMDHLDTVQETFSNWLATCENGEDQHV